MMSNQALFARYLAWAGLHPLILHYVDYAEESGRTGPEKRQLVIDVCVATVDTLQKQGVFPAGLRDKVAKVAGEIVDAVVAIHNTSGLFEHAAARYLSGDQVFDENGNPIPPASFDENGNPLSTLESREAARRRTFVDDNGIPLPLAETRESERARTTRRKGGRS